MSPETRRVANEWNFSVGWTIPLIRTKQKAAVYGRQCVRPTKHMEHITVVSHSSCSTTFEHYPISLTHDSHNLNSLPTAEHSASILLLPPTIANERFFPLLKHRSVQSIFMYFEITFFSRDGIKSSNRGSLFWMPFLSACFRRAELTGNKLWNNHIQQ